MDLLPIPPRSTNKVDTAISLANDGGSKSNTGYFNSAGHGEKKESGQVDEVNFSNSSATNENEDADFIQKIKNYLNKIKEFILRLLGSNNKKEINNIYKKDN